MTQPRAEQDNSRPSQRQQSRKWIPSEQQQRVSNSREDEKEDQADSGPDRDHPITRQSRAK
jgi:hypothetical protein